MSPRNVTLRAAASEAGVLLHNATVYYPGLVLVEQPQLPDLHAHGGHVDRGYVVYDLRGPCDDRNLFPVTPKGSLFVYSHSVWGVDFGVTPKASFSCPHLSSSLSISRICS